MPLSLEKLFFLLNGKPRACSNPWQESKTFRPSGQRILLHRRNQSCLHSFSVPGVGLPVFVSKSLISVQRFGRVCRFLGLPAILPSVAMDADWDNDGVLTYVAVTRLHSYPLIRVLPICMARTCRSDGKCR